MFKPKKFFSSLLIHQIEIIFLFLGFSTLNSTLHTIKPKVCVRDQKCKGPPLGIFSDIGSNPNPHSFILSLVESTMDIPKIKKLFRSDVLKKMLTIFFFKVGLLLTFKCKFYYSILAPIFIYMILLMS
jgi:hypothetical protein